jgi:hypothetical protein
MLRVVQLRIERSYDIFTVKETMRITQSKYGRHTAGVVCPNTPVSSIANSTDTLFRQDLYMVVVGESGRER